MDELERKEHLEKILTFIVERSRYFESNFDSVYSKLTDEFQRETERLNDFKKNHYLNNLRQTIHKQAESFLKAKKKDKLREFRYFIIAFKQDVQDELMMIKYRQTNDSTPPPL